MRETTRVAASVKQLNLKGCYATSESTTHTHHATDPQKDIKGTCFLTVTADKNGKLIPHDPTGWDEQAYSQRYYPPKLKTVFRDMTFKNRALVLAEVCTEDYPQDHLDQELHQLQIGMWSLRLLSRSDFKFETSFGFLSLNYMGHVIFCKTKE